MPNFVTTTPALHKKIISKTIFIGGYGRAGTTIVGKLIASFKSVEYFFEPEHLKTIFPLIIKINYNEWNLIFSNYLVEDLYFNALAGRKININKNDSSYIYDVREKKEILKRLKFSARREVFFKKNINPKMVIKCLDNTKYFYDLHKKYPSIKFIFMKRNVLDSLLSIKNKAWFKNDNLIPAQSPMFRIRNKYFPHWLDKKDIKFWLTLNEYERCAHYILELSKYEKKINNKVIFDYDELIENPSLFANKISKKLNLKFGPKTNKIIKSIKEQKVYQDIDLFKKIRPSLLNKLNLLPSGSLF